MPRRWKLFGLFAGVALGVIATVAPAQESDAAIERTRRQVKMLDDLYKTAVVLITTHYVTANSSLPAGSAAIALFDAMKEKGWHEVRLLDATGSPLMAKNVATDAFAREAIARLKAGESYYDTVAEREGKRYLRAVTPIPVVMEKCIMCHPNYAQAQQGEPIGVLAYTVPIE